MLTLSAALLLLSSASAQDLLDPLDPELALEEPELAMPADVAPPEQATPRVVGGAPSPVGKWPDAVYVTSNGGACTGTLIHPKWVLTAAHCIGGLNEALLNAVDISVRFESDASLGGAERMRIVREVAFDQSWQRSGGVDIALVELERPSEKVKPRIIGRDCITEDFLVDGADVTIVGWGVTQGNGTGNTDVQMEGVSQVQTADCSVGSVNGIVTGCQTPGGEIGAGGNGVDACFGDSGGPLYLTTPTGTYVVGATSRSYQGVPFSQPCEFGGIWSRPDYVMDWIEETIGEELPHPACTPPPEANPEPVWVPSGGKRTQTLGLVDPDQPGLTYEIVRPPLHGRVVLDGRGGFTLAADPDYIGIDSFAVRVSTAAVSEDWPDSPPATTDLVIPVSVGGGCGCRSTGPIPSSLMALSLLALFRRRR